MTLVEKLPEGARPLPRTARPLTGPEFKQCLLHWLSQMELPEGSFETIETWLGIQTCLSRSHNTVPRGYALLGNNWLLIRIGPAQELRLSVPTGDVVEEYRCSGIPDEDRIAAGLPIPVEVRYPNGQTQLLKLPFEALPGRSARSVDVGAAAPEPAPEPIVEPEPAGPPQFARSIEIAEEDLLATPPQPQIDHVPTEPAPAPAATVSTRKPGRPGKKGAQ